MASTGFIDLYGQKGAIEIATRSFDRTPCGDAGAPVPEETPERD